MRKPLFTIGYEGADLADFVETIVACEIAQVIDVREVPISRKRGFSKNGLAGALAVAGIAYLHLQKLGDPKAGREAARQGNFPAFREIYDRHLKTPAAQADLRAAASAADKMTSCLLCFERAPEQCHRSIVAAALAKKAGFAIEHIGVRRTKALGKRIPERDHDLAIPVG